MNATTLAKCPCNNCSGNIEFESDYAGQTVPCPHCGLDTVLFLARIPLLQPVIPPSSPKPEKHSVFYYVFSGVLSLIGTVLIIGFGLLVVGIAVPAFLSARKTAQQNYESASSTNSAIAATNSISPAVKRELEKRDYIEHSIKLYAVSAHYRETELDGRLPAAEFKLQNLGDRDLKEVEVSFFFKDRENRTIAEKKFYPVFASAFSAKAEDQPLKPGYIWQIERGRIYTAKNIPDEWVENKFQAKITGIEFSE
jgi:DNA-directed RNA polymerase subunit RPC12/RpoP